VTVTPGTLRLSALGGPHTFGGQAARLMRDLYPEFGDLSYYETSELAQRALDRGEVDATCVPEQMSHTGFHLGTQLRIARPSSERFVAAEVTHAYHCSLLVKPGTTRDRVRRVLGHTGSITQSRAWLERHLPGARISIVETSSLGAIQEVLDGDGTLAAVGTPDAARALGLEELATDIDGGSVASYWALTARPLFSDRPTRVVTVARGGVEGSLGAVVAALATTGFRAQTVASLPSGRALFEYDHVIRSVGAGTLDAVQRAIAQLPDARLVGAFEARGLERPP
jgi:prephenate dehydratase